MGGSGARAATSPEPVPSNWRNAFCAGWKHTSRPGLPTDTASKLCWIHSAHFVLWDMSSATYFATPRSPFDKLPMNLRRLPRPGRCPGLMAGRPFRAHVISIHQMPEVSSPDGAAIHQPGAAPRATVRLRGVHGLSKPASSPVGSLRVSGVGIRRHIYANVYFGLGQFRPERRTDER
jgi:hypothetical protein